MTLPHDTKRALVAPLVFDGTTKSEAVNLKGFALAGVLITTAIAGTSVSFEVAYEDANEATFVPLKDKYGTTVSIPTTTTGMFSLAGSVPLGVHAIKLVSSASETENVVADATAFLIGQPVL